VRSLTDSIKKIIKKLKKSFDKEKIDLKRVIPPKVSNVEYNDNSLSEGENHSSSEEEKDVEPENININVINRNQFSVSESLRNQRISENQQNSNIQSISINEINRNIIIDSQEDNIALNETLSRNLPRTITLEKYDTNSADFKRKIGEKLVYKKIERFSDNNDLNTLLDTSTVTQDNICYLLIKFSDETHNVKFGILKHFEEYMMKICRDGETSLIGGKTKRLKQIIKDLSNIYKNRRVNLAFEYYHFIEDLYAEFIDEEVTEKYKISDRILLDTLKFKKYRKDNKL
jgi:hypothetical protein